MLTAPTQDVFIEKSLKLHQRYTNKAKYYFFLTSCWSETLPPFHWMEVGRCHPATLSPTQGKISSKLFMALIRVSCFSLVWSLVCSPQCSQKHLTAATFKAVPIKNSVPRLTFSSIWIVLQSCSNKISSKRATI